MSRHFQDYSNNIDFNKVTWGQMLILCKALQVSSSLELETVERWYSAESINFNETLNLLISLGVAKVGGEKIVLNTALKKIILRDDESIRRFFVDLFFQKKENLARYFGDYFDKFQPYGDEYRFIPSTYERLKYSGVRNFLMGLGVVVWETNYHGYSITKELSVHLLDREKILPYDEFVKKLKSEEALGYAAELMVLEYERGKFSGNPNIQKDIRHVSLEDVRSGYDIRSFYKQDEGRWAEKYIEVKVVSEDDWRFYWSRNEIDKARQSGKSYYLYLLPSKNAGMLDIHGLKEIKNPYREVFQNQNDWLRETEVTSFYKKSS